MNEYLTTTEAARLLGVTPGRVRQLLRDDAIPHIGGSVRLMTRRDVEAFAAIPRKPGRQRKNSPGVGD